MTISDVIISDRELAELLRLCRIAGEPDREAVQNTLCSIRENAVKKAIADIVQMTYASQGRDFIQDVSRLTLVSSDGGLSLTSNERRKVLEVLWWLFRFRFSSDPNALILACGYAPIPPAKDKGGDGSGD